jgi:hypothetical protein
MVNGIRPSRASTCQYWYVLGDQTFQELVHSLGASAAGVEAAVARVPTAAWDEVIHTGDGPWTRRQLLAHIAANDLRQLARIRVGAGVADDDARRTFEAQLETHAWNQARVDERAARTPAELIAEMRANREALIDLLESLTPEQRSRPMPFRGELRPLEEMVPTLLGHIEGHAAEL